jgi:hypothetical protein
MVSSSLIRRLSQAVDEVEKRLKPSWAWKVVKVPRGWEEDPDTALDRHYAAHPEDRGADIVIFKFCEIENKD